MLSKKDSFIEFRKFLTSYLLCLAKTGKLYIKVMHS